MTNNIIKKIWMIGREDLPTQVQMMKKGFESLGIIVRVTNLQNIWNELLKQPNSSYYTGFKNPYKISPPDDFPDFDLVFIDHFSPLLIFIDTLKPKVYWYREQYHIPTCVNPDYLIYANPESYDYILWQHPQIFTNVKSHREFSLCADPDLFKKVEWKKRKKGLSFTGTTLPEGLQHWIFQTAYEKRNQIIKAMESREEIHFENRIKPLEYERVLPTHQMDLVVFGRTPMGQRLFEAGAAYVIPVIWYENEEMLQFYQSLGFVYKIEGKISPKANCCLFNTLDEVYDFKHLDNIILEQISEQAHELIVKRHSPAVRAKELVDWLQDDHFEDMMKSGFNQLLEIPIRFHDKVLTKDFLDFRELITGNCQSLAKISRLYQDGPSGAVRTFVKILQGQVLSEYAMLPEKYFFYCEMKDMSLCFDVCTRPEYRGKGLFTQMGQAVTQWEANHGTTFSLGFPNSKAIEGHKRNNWTFLGERPIYESTNILNNKLVMRWENEYMNEKSMNQNDVVEIQTISSKDLEFLMNINKIRFNVILNRNESWFDWRWRNNESGEYHEMSIRNSSNGRILGYVVFKHYNHEKVHIVDMLTTGEMEEEVFKIILIHLREHMIDAVVEYSSFMLTDHHPFVKFCLDNKIFTKVKDPGFVICKSYNDWKPKLEDFYITFGDTDNY